MIYYLYKPTHLVSIEKDSKILANQKNKEKYPTFYKELLEQKNSKHTYKLTEDAYQEALIWTQGTED